MIQRSVSYLLCAFLLIVSVTNSAKPEKATMLQVSEMNEPRQRMSRSIRRSNFKPVYQKISPLEEKPENSRALIALSELNTSTDIEKLIQSPLGEDILSTIVTSLVHQEGQTNNIIPEVLENLWEGENRGLNFRDEKQHLPEEEIRSRFPNENNNDAKEKPSNSLTTVIIISPALLPSQEEYDMDEWIFRDPRITSQHQVARLNVNKDVHEILAVLSSVQHKQVHSRPSTVRSNKQPRSFSRPEENLQSYNTEYMQYPSSLPPYNKEDYYYEYPQDDSLEEIKEQECDVSDYDYQDDIRFKESDFSAGNLGRIAAHKHNQVKFIWDLFHHGWPLWLE